MKFKYLFLIAVAGFVGIAEADVVPRMPTRQVKKSSMTFTAVSGSTLPAIVLKELPNNAFCSGEKLKFAIKYEFVSAGTATMEIKEAEPMNGRPTLHIESKAESNSFVDSFFKVRDFNSATIDKASLVSLHFHQNLREGGYNVIRNTSFDYANHVYKFQRIRKGKTTERSGPLNMAVHDILSSFYVARTLPLAPGKRYDITVFSDEEIYQLVIHVSTKTQTVSVPAGKFNCIRLDPIVLGDGIFKAKDGKMSIWMTNDERKMPVLIRSRVFIGAFDAELEEFRFETR